MAHFEPVLEYVSSLLLSKHNIAYFMLNLLPLHAHDARHFTKAQIAS